MKAYYNENDPGAAAWLRELIREGLIADGDVDERSICDVQGRDLEGFSQIHLFAGIGGWSRAFRLAGWSDDRPVWSGSVPCQGFSSAGTRKGHGDTRNLWPEMLRLIRERRPATVFGEQVEAAIRFGWLDGVFVDLEEQAYACGAIVLPAAGAGAPHIRSRIFWVADGDSQRCQVESQSHRDSSKPAQQASRRPDVDGCGGYGGLAHAGYCPGRAEQGNELQECDRRAGQSGAWRDFDLVACRDGKARRFEPGSFPLVDGIPGRVGLLRGYGNAIVPQVAAAFIQAYCEVTSSPLTEQMERE